MNGARTIAALLVGFLVLCALGFSVASCVSEREPPMPRDPNEVWLERQSAAPLRLADTMVVRFEVLSDDAYYRLSERCRREGGTPSTHAASFVQCDYGGNARAGWMYTVDAVPSDKRGVR